MRTARVTTIKLVKDNFSHIENQSAKENLRPAASLLETAVKHYLFYNLDILLEVSKYEKMEGNPETAAEIIREYEFLNLIKPVRN